MPETLVDERNKKNQRVLCVVVDFQARVFGGLVLQYEVKISRCEMTKVITMGRIL